MIDEVTEDLPDTIDWENPPTIRDLKQDITDAEIDNEAYQQDVERWLDNLYIKGSAKLTKVAGRSSVQPKVIRKQAEWRYSGLSTPFLSTPDIFKVSPKTAGDRKRAQQNALVLNHQFNNNIKKVTFINSYARDLVDIGTAILEVGWITEEEEIEEEVPVYDFYPVRDEQVMQKYMNLLQLKQQSRDIYEQYMNPGLDQAVTLFAQTGELVVPEQTGTEIVTRIVETKNHPTVSTCEVTNMVIDPTCNGDYSKAGFICKKFESSLSELKKDGRYFNLDKVMVEEANPLSDPDYKENDDVQNFTFKDEPRKKLVVHAYWGSWDIHKTGIVSPILVCWINNVIVRMEKNPFPFKTAPFVFVPYMPVRRSVFGEPDGELLEDNQNIVGAVSRGMIDLMGKSANGQQGTKAGFLDTTNKRKFKKGEDYEYNSQGSPEQSIYQHKYPEIPASAFNMISMQNADAESLSGVKAFSSGINSKALGDSVGGGRDALDAASKRESDILTRMAEGLKEVGRMFIAMNAEWLSDEEVIRITDEEFVTVRRDDLSGSFDLELGISTPEENQKKAEGLEFLLQTTGNNMDFTLRSMILSDIARLKKMPDLAKKIEDYRPEPDPMAVKKAELEIMLLEQQIAKEQALTAKHAAEAGANQGRGIKDMSQANLNTAKATTEEAKTRNLHSDSDTKDLNYIEQHTGVKHNREIEKDDRKAMNDIVGKQITK